MRYLVFLSIFFVGFWANGQNWNETIKVVASDRGGGDWFGESVAISDDYAIVGAEWEDEDASGANTMIDAGSAYIFKRNNNNTWIEKQKIVASDRDLDDWFGCSVAIFGDYLIVGAHSENEDVSGANTMWWAGSAYVFEKDSLGVWTEKQKIVASDRGSFDDFGFSVDISDNYLIVGAFNEDEDATGNNTLSKAGSAYIFERDSLGTWTEKQKIVAADRGIDDYFGYSVAISDDYAIIGARQESHNVSGGSNMPYAGSAYIFERNSLGNWMQKQKIVASDRASTDNFGVAVDISGDQIIVGASSEDEDASGANTLSNSGSAYIFERDSLGTWTEKQKIVASDREAGDIFGVTVSLLDNYAIVGAAKEDEDASGANTMNSAGSAYIFKRNNLGTWTEKQKIVAADRGINDRFGVSVAISNDNAVVGAYYEDEDTSGANTMSDAGSAYIFGLTCSGIPTFSSITVSSCDSYTSPSGKAWTVSNTYTDTILNATYCDSIITINLTINVSPTVSAFGSTAICNGQSTTISASGGTTYIWNNGGGSGSNVSVSPSVTTVYTVNGTTNGCSDTAQATVTVNYPTTSTDIQTACNSYLWIDGNTYTSSNTTAIHTLTNAAGCDSVITLNLTINSIATSSTISPVVCDSYISPSGKLWTISNTYMDTIPNAATCDSVITINLTINNSTSGTISPVACDNYVSPSGKIWTVTNTYMDTIANIAGCDSIMTLNLTINNSTSTTVDTTIINGESYFAGGALQTTAGTYYDTLATTQGCDSVIITNLDVVSGIGDAGSGPGEVSVVPNPFVQSFTVRVSSAKSQELSLKVFDVLGQEQPVLS